MARSFDGTANAKLTLGSAVYATYPFTMAAWAYPTNDAITSSVITQSGSVNGNYVLLDVSGTEAGDPFRCLAYDGANIWGTSQTGVTFNAWNHFCGVFTNASTIVGYLNGVAGSTVGAGSPTPTVNTTGVGAFNGLNNHSGNIAEAAIWNVALTADERAMLAAGFSPLFVRPSALVAYWPLIGRFSPEIPRKGTAELTVGNGVGVADHPRIIYPSGPRIVTKAAPVTPTPPVETVPTVVAAGRPRRERFIAKYRGQEHEFRTAEELEQFIADARKSEQRKPVKKRKVITARVNPDFQQELYHFDLPDLTPVIEQRNFDELRDILNRYEIMRMHLARERLEREDEELLLLLA